MVTMLPKRRKVARCHLSAAPPERLALDGGSEAPGHARQYAREFIDYYLPETAPAQVDDMLLIVSELVTNAVRYGTEPGDSLLVVLDLSVQRLRVEVHDPIRRHPKFRPESEERQRGRGLFIVEALAACWGVTDRPFGKAVWAEVAR
ncbi:ATP-binding protein [Streptomyces sp. RKAG293]|uniref:ATP-binding protein n=1 Tax=Streptomyces sp. RKAG293 TaxID=2893403 RepID=UPI002033B227|nr:ATP-binding protein [Streptomyces sp. RKAG293]MCM2420316.1 ATP-binding protein [Streptomyces sp. RKAG293]